MARLSLALLVGGVLAWTCLAVSGEDPPGAPIPDGSFSLYPGSVFEVPTPPAYEENDARPGSNDRLAPPFPGSPPQVPHGIRDFLPITLEDNACVNCHLAEPDPEEDAPPLPTSHRRDLRNDPSALRDEAAGARWICTACHVPVTDAEPLPQGVPAR